MYVECTGDLGSREGRLQLVINCSVRDETEGLGLWNLKEKQALWNCMAFLAGMIYFLCFVRSCFCRFFRVSIVA